MFYTSGRFVRGPSRVSGSGWKEMVIELPDEKKAQMTCDNLNELVKSLPATRCNTCQGTGTVKNLHNWCTGGKREQKCWACSPIPSVSVEPATPQKSG
jgi:hypothetical protein